MTQPTNQAKTYQHESLYGTDYYCPRCHDERGVKEVMGDVVVDQLIDGKLQEVFDGFYCEYCVDKLGDKVGYSPGRGDLEGYEVGGTLGYPDD